MSGQGYCLSLFVLCNGVWDCPVHDDEHLCHPPTCPDLYRCRGSTVCLHVKHVCDGWSQCPEHDDENFCNLTCPYTCTCDGHSYLCNHTVSLSQHTELRFLHANGSGIQLTDLASNTMLVYLNLAMCQLKLIGNASFANLHILDLSLNLLKHISAKHMKNFPKLTSLSLAGNPILSLFIDDESVSSPFLELRTFDLSFVEMKEMNPNELQLFPSLQSLNLSHCHVHHVQGQGFQLLNSLQVLDVRSCPLTSFPRSVFQGLNSLRHVLADNYKLCCPATLPKWAVVDQCLALADEVSSCDALLRSDMYRVSLAVFASLATVGNILSLVLRVFVLTGKQQSGYTVFVTHLCMSDFLMGVYLVMIGAADRIYLNSYLWEDKAWKNSVTCKMAGFLSLLSSEVS